MSGERPSWDFIFMAFAWSLSKRSTCGRLQVGCVIVSDDNTRVLAMGYNGGAKKVFNDCQSNEPGKCGHVHAETNALIKLDYHEPTRKRMYVTHAPCSMCATSIVNGNISEVVYESEYRTTEGLEILKAAGIDVRKLEGDVPVEKVRIG